MITLAYILIINSCIESDSFLRLPLCNTVRASTRYVSDRSRLQVNSCWCTNYETYHTHVLFFERYVRVLTYSILAYTCTRIIEPCISLIQMKLSSVQCKIVVKMSRYKQQQEAQLVLG